MSTMRAVAVFTFIRVCLASWPWVIGSPALPLTPVYGTAAGIWNGTIFIMGGNGAQGRNVMEFDTTTWNSTDISSLHLLASQTYCRGQCYAQKDEILYMIQMSGGNIETFNLITKESTSNAITSPISLNYVSMICSSDDHLFVFDGTEGGNYNWTAFRFSNSTWIENLPALQKKRNQAACIVSQDRLFMFGGYFYVQYSSTDWHNTNEEISAINFASDSWKYTASLALRLDKMRVAAYEDLIFITGGYTTSHQYNTQKTFQIMNITSNTITVSPFNLPYGLIEHSMIVQFPFIYLFGGYRSALGVSNSWVYLDLLATAHPTSSPSAAPTNEPTQSTSSPSKAPTAARCGTQTEIYYEDASELTGDEYNWRVSDYNGWEFYYQPAYGDNYCYFETCYSLTHYHYYGYIDQYDPEPQASTVYLSQNAPIDVSSYADVKLKFALAGGPTGWASNNGGSRCTMKYMVDGGASWITAKYITIGSSVQPQKYTKSVGSTASIKLKLELRQQNYQSHDSCYLDEISVCGTLKTTTIAPTSSEPTESPSLFPTIAPTKAPSLFPTQNPSFSPTKMPSLDPTNTPTNEPSTMPTFEPTFDPTLDPTIDPTLDPTYIPTVDPTERISTENSNEENEETHQGEAISSDKLSKTTMMLLVLVVMASLMLIATLYFVINWWKEKRNKANLDRQHMDPEPDIVPGVNGDVDQVNEATDEEEAAPEEGAVPEGQTGVQMTTADV